jgi:predicted GNAT family acetyltransferase
MNILVDYQILRDGDYFRLLYQEKQRIGYIHFYEDDRHRYVVDATVVDPSFRGQGLANHLMNAVIELARVEKKYIYPLCSFAVRVLENERFHDLWDPQEGSPVGGGYCAWLPDNKK